MQNNPNRNGAPVRPSKEDVKEFERIIAEKHNTVLLADSSSAERGDAVEFTAIGRIVSIDGEDVTLIYENPILTTQATFRIKSNQLTRKLGLLPRVGEQMYFQESDTSEPVLIGLIAWANSKQIVVDGVDGEAYLVSPNRAKRISSNVLCCTFYANLTTVVEGYENS
jgi:hypothetical protein